MANPESDQARQGPQNRSPDEEASAGTLATYEQIADIYYEKWQDRSAIERQLTRFVAMIRAYGLAGLPVVDLGCGPGFDAAFFRRSGLWAIGADLSVAMMTAGRPHFGGDYVQADMRHLPFSALGGLWVSASLLHVPRDQTRAVLQGFAGALAPGGLLYLSLKAGKGAEWKQMSHGQPLPRYFVYWQPETLDPILEAAGFQIVEGWVSAGSGSTAWLIRFARNPSSARLFPLKIG